MGGRANLGYTRLDAKTYPQARRQCTMNMMCGKVDSLM